MDDILSEEQKKKLVDLDKQMKHKREYEIKHKKRREMSSELTGIPENLIDIDVVKIGIMLGIIKKKTVIEGKEPNTGSLFDVIFGDNDIDAPANFQVPTHYRQATYLIEESEKKTIIENNVQQQSVFFSNIMTTTFNKRLENIRAFVDINVASQGIESFVTALTETLNILLEEVLSDNDQYDDRLWKALQVTRNNLLGPVNVCEYKNIVINQIKQLLDRSLDKERIAENLTPIEKQLTLYPDGDGFSNPCASTPHPFLIEELQFRAFTSDPQLKAFEFRLIIQQCCTPSLLFTPIPFVLDTVMIGPYLNNSIGYLNQEDISNFYVLSEITNEGARLWVLDPDLDKFTVELEHALCVYLMKLFRTFYKKCFCTNKYIPHFEKPETTCHSDVFITLLNNIAFIRNKYQFKTFITQLVKKKSFIIPTKYDFFNSFAPETRSTSEPNNSNSNLNDLLFDK